MTADRSWRDVESREFDPILTAAIEEFYEHSFHGTSVRTLAARVGVTVPALYYHYANKEAILLALLDTATQDLLERAQAAVADAGEDPVRRFSNVVEALVLTLTANPRLSALESEIRYLGAASRKRQVRTRDRIEALLLAAVRGGCDAGVFATTDPVETTRAVLGMLQWIPYWYRTDGDLGRDEVARKYVDIALATVGHAQTSPRRRQSAR